MQSTNGEGEQEGDALRPRRGMSVEERIRAEDSYGILLILTLVSLIVTAASGGSEVGRVAALVVQGGVLLYALRTSRAASRVLRTALIVVPPVVLVAAILSAGESDVAAAAVTGLSAALAAGAIGAIVRRVGAHPRVDAATILGALCTYLLIGTFFAYLFMTVGAIGDQAFFVTESAPRSVDFMYFSFVTMTTVGYGDLTAAADLGRMLAVTEALIGQLYLVTVVSLVVGNVGRERRRP